MNIGMTIYSGVQFSLSVYVSDLEFLEDVIVVDDSPAVMQTMLDEIGFWWIKCHSCCRFCPPTEQHHAPRRRGNQASPASSEIAGIPSPQTISEI